MGRTKWGKIRRKEPTFLPDDDSDILKLLKNYSHHHWPLSGHGVRGSRTVSIGSVPIATFMHSPTPANIIFRHGGQGQSLRFDSSLSVSLNLLMNPCRWWWTYEQFSYVLGIPFWKEFVQNLFPDTVCLGEKWGGDFTRPSRLGCITHEALCLKSRKFNVNLTLPIKQIVFLPVDLQCHKTNIVRK